MADLRIGDRPSVERALDIRIGTLTPAGSGWSYAEVSGWLAGPQDFVRGYSVESRNARVPDITVRLRLSLGQAPCIRLRDVAQVLLTEREAER